MRILWSFINLLFVFSLSAQVITTDFQYQVGTQRQVVTNPSEANDFLLAAGGGTDFVWDFRDFLPIPESSTFTKVVSPVSLSLADTFSRANLGLLIESDASEEYLIQTDSTVELAGILTSDGMRIFYPNTFKLMEFPLLLGGSFADDYNNIVINSEGDTLEQNQFAVTCEFRATGMLQLPTGDYENCFLIRYDVSVNGNPPTEIIYRWYSGSLSNQMIEVVVDRFTFQVLSLTWQKSLADIVNVEDGFINALNIKWLSQNKFVVNSDKKRTIQCSISDVNGRTVWQLQREILTGEQEISVPNLPAAGVYFFTVQDVKNQELKTIQFTAGY